MAAPQIQLSSPISVGQQTQPSVPISVEQVVVLIFAGGKVTDAYANVLLWLVGNMILDPSRLIVGFLKKKVFSFRSRWVLYNGHGNNAVRVFSIEKASLCFSNGDMRVRGANEALKIKGTWEDKDYSIYNDDRMVALMESMGNDEFKVIVYSSAHYELVTKVFATLQIMNSSTSSTGDGGCCKRVLEAFGDIGQGLTGITNCINLCQSDECL